MNKQEIVNYLKCARDKKIREESKMTVDDQRIQRIIDSVKREIEKFETKISNAKRRIEALSAKTRMYENYIDGFLWVKNLVRKDESK